jgi:peptidoglycan/LPS O-acetylase OafA/YrhL
MRVGWMLLIVAAALAVGSAVGVDDAAFFFFVLPALFMLALGIAAALLLPLIIGRAATGRTPKPPWPLIAAALALATLIVFPVQTRFSDDRGNCTGTIPLAERLLGGDGATVVLTSACDEVSVQIGGSS